MIAKQEYDGQFKRLRCCVLIPTYNNATTIKAVLDNVLDYTTDVCVVNDGSTDNTLQLLKEYGDAIKLFSYDTNKGKGWALRQGFSFAVSQGYDYAITLDSDGQHFADDLPTMLQALENNPDAIIIGARNMGQAGVPGKSSFGNKFSNFWVWLETGVQLPDTQSGYRLYPVQQLQGITFFTRKYEFEIEVIVRGSWNGLNLIQVPVKVYYPPASERISHFRPFKDFTRISVLNSVLVTWAVLWIKPRDFVVTLVKKDWRTLLELYLIRSHETPAVKAFSVGLGVFFGIAPLWGLQMWFVLLFAWIFRLNKGLAVLASNISIPPMIPIIVFLSYETGRIWMGDKAMHLVFNKKLTIEDIHKNLLQYVLGSFTLGLICSVIAAVATYYFVKHLKQAGASTKRDIA
jgi:glycosyltransferase involved in cell wall biosynthesis